MAANRRRLGVALLLDPPVADEVDGLRRALGDPSLGRISPHITLVPPVNVRGPDLPAALERLRAAAASQPGALRLTFGALSTFLPQNPVLYLGVGGDLERLRALRDALFVPPLERVLSWPWVPHVTLADGVAEELIRAGLGALGAYAATGDLDRVVLLEERPGRVWEPIADVELGPPARIGTGGLTLEVTAGRLLDPGAAAPSPPQGGPGTGVPPIALTGRRLGRAVGVAKAWVDLEGAHVWVWVDPGERGQGVGGHLLAHLEARARRAGWRHEVLDARGPAGFYRARSRWSVAASA